MLVKKFPHVILLNKSHGKITAKNSPKFFRIFLPLLLNNKNIENI